MRLSCDRNGESESDSESANPGKSRYSVAASGVLSLRLESLSRAVLSYGTP